MVTMSLHVTSQAGKQGRWLTLDDLLIFSVFKEYEKKNLKSGGMGLSKFM